jgi:sec-independent protein translocase protein TatB
VSFGLTFEKLLVIGIIAVFLLGPDRLPYYASQLARFVKSLRSMANGAKDRMREEMGPDFDDIDWKKLDPRQYDPRRIIREALIDDEEPAVKVRKPMEGAYARQQREKAEAAAAGATTAPYDSEST